MALNLIKVRKCDGACCKAAPRWPNKAGTDCEYRTNVNQSKGCAVHNKGFDLTSLPISPAQPEKSGEQCFNDTCKNWPHNIENLELGMTGNCCYQVVEV